MSNANLIDHFMLCPLCRRDDVRIIVRPGDVGPVLEDHRSGIVCCATPEPGVLDARTLLLCKVQCPASGQAVTQMCDGEHAGPEVCGDPQCYHTENPKDGAFPHDPGAHGDRFKAFRTTPPDRPVEILDHDGNRVSVRSFGSGSPLYVCGCGRAIYEHERPECSRYPTEPLVQIGYKA